MWVLNKRITRNLCVNKSRWMAILLLIILCVYLVESYFGMAGVMSYNHALNFKNNNARDGRFTTLAELTDEEIQGITDMGFILEKEFSVDYPTLDSAKLRAFIKREKVDLVFCDEGKVPENSNEMVIEKSFCRENDLHLGDIINVAGLDFVISGIGGSPDAEYVFDIAGEITDHKIFGNCYVTKEAYEKLKNTDKMIGTESLRYGYKKIDSKLDDTKLEDYLRSLDFDKTRIKNKFFVQMLNEIITQKTSIENNMDESMNVSEDMDNFADFMDVDLVELFDPLSYNTGIQNTADKNMKTAGSCGVIALILISFILIVFVSHEIDNESAVIGVFYSMGIKKSSLIKHYMMIPVIISFIGGIVGTIVGLSPLGVDLMLGPIEMFYSLPNFVHYFDWTIVFAGFLAPVMISTVVSIIVVNKKLSRSPLSMLRHEKKVSKIKGVNTSRLSFINSFRIKQIMNELSTSIVVFIGILLPLILMIFALDFGVSIKPLIENTKKEIAFENMYIMKYAPLNIPANSEEAYIENLEISGKIDNCDVSVVGIKNNSSCFYFSIQDNPRNSISVGSGTALKYGIKKGDMITLYSKNKHRYYTFNVANVVDYSMGLYIFMNIDDMRDMFGKNNKYYNTLISNEKIDIEDERVLAKYSKDSIIFSAETNVEGMLSSVVVFISISILAFFTIAYLMIKLMIDRAKINISMLKIFGYHESEIKKLYIDGNFYVILLSSVLGIPIAKVFVDKFWFPISNINIDIGYDIHYPIWMYLLILVTIMILYFIISNVLRLVINRIPMSEVLKNRE